MDEDLISKKELLERYGTPMARCTAGSGWA